MGNLLEKWKEVEKIPEKKKKNRRKASIWDAEKLLSEIKEITTYTAEDFVKKFAKTEMNPEEPSTLKSIRRFLSRIKRKENIDFELVQGIVIIYNKPKEKILEE